MEAIVQNTSRVRSWVQAYRWYKIGGIKDVTPVGEASEERLDKSFRDWLSLGKEYCKTQKRDKKKRLMNELSIIQKGIGQRDYKIW
jgi:hypothetical protein